MFVTDIAVMANMTFKTCLTFYKKNENQNWMPDSTLSSLHEKKCHNNNAPIVVRSFLYFFTFFDGYTIFLDVNVAFYHLHV